MLDIKNVIFVSVLSVGDADWLMENSRALVTNLIAESDSKIVYFLFRRFYCCGNMLLNCAGFFINGEWDISFATAATSFGVRLTAIMIAKIFGN